MTYFSKTPSITYLNLAPSYSPGWSSESELSIRSLNFWVRVSYIGINEVRGDADPFLFRNNPLLKPLYRFPTLEFDENLIGIDILEEIEEDTAVDSIACDVERLVYLDKDVGHVDLSCNEK